MSVRRSRTAQKLIPRSRSRSAHRRARRKAPFWTDRILPRTLGVRPSLVLFIIGGLLLFWQLIVVNAFPEARRWLSGQTAGMAGLIVLVIGLAVLWMESSGLRGESSRTPARRTKKSDSS